MQRKYEKYQDYKEIIQSKAKVSFGTISPVRSVTAPDSMLFIAWAGNLSPVSGTSLAMGTVDVCRGGDNLLKFDKYTIHSTATPSLLELVGPQKPDYHWTQNLPEHLSDAPNWVQESVKKAKKGEVGT